MTRRDFFGRLFGLAGAGVAAAAMPPPSPPPAPAAVLLDAGQTWTVSTGQTWTCSSGIDEARFLRAVAAHRKAAAP